MTYLSYEEFDNFKIGEVDVIEFDKFINKACDVIDSVTNFYYQHNNLENDISFRKIQFKKAIAAQVKYFSDLGGSSIEEIQSAQSVTIGRTSISKGSNSHSKQEKQSLTSEDALMYLKSTGLLYTGIGVI